MHPFKIVAPTLGLRAEIEERLIGLDAVPQFHEQIVQAWASAVVASNYSNLSQVPFSIASDYSLVRHVNEVVECGLTLAEKAETFWGKTVDRDVLIPAMILHDVDKPLMTERDATGTVSASSWSRELPHGVLGAMILKECGFSHQVVSIVATHSAVSPFHNGSIEAFILHYADFFSADQVLMNSGQVPYYQRRRG